MYEVLQVIELIETFKEKYSDYEITEHSVSNPFPQDISNHCPLKW